MLEMTKGVISTGVEKSTIQYNTVHFSSHNEDSLLDWMGVR
jgi:hypothetical protein